MKFEKQQDKEKEFSRNEVGSPTSPMVIDLKKKYCKQNTKVT
jgi:hypothetical protein